MRLAERLGGFIDWPMSRKLFLLGFVGMFASLLAVVVNAVTFSTVGAATMNLPLLNGLFLLWIPAQGLLTAVAVPAARAGREGKGAAYLFVLVQSPFIVALLYLFGTMSTPLVAIYPAIVILWTLVLDERIALFGFCNLVGWMIVCGVLETTHHLPYAPVLPRRAIDDQNTAVWFSAVFFHILVLLGFCISLCVLFQRTRRSQNARLHQAHDALERAHRLISRYVPPRLAQQIASGAYPESGKPERRKLSIVFTGIEGFATAAEELEAEDLAAVLGGYLSEMVAIADRHDGTVNHLVGDRMLILFGAPHATSDHDHALRATQMALEMQQRAARMRELWSRHGLQRPFRIRIGINTGYVSVGDFGSEGRKLYSGIGLQTNIAERIQAECAPGQVLLSHHTWALVHQERECRAQGEIVVKGLPAPLRLYTLVLDQTADSIAVAPAGAQSSSAAALNGAHLQDRLQAAAELVWNFGNARFDEASLELFVAGELVELERKPLEVLRHLLRHSGEVVSKDDLLAAVWPGRILSETVIAKCVSRIREVLHDDEQCMIKTVHGYGYRLTTEIRLGSGPVALPAGTP